MLKVSEPLRKGVIDKGADVVLVNHLEELSRPR